MKQLTLRGVSLLFMCTLIFASCDSDDDAIDDDFQGKTKEYELESVSNTSVEGTVNFEENEDGTTTVVIDLEGTDEDETYSSRILYGNTTEPGEVAIALDDIDGESGTGSTIISELDDETSVTFEDIMELDAHVNIYLVEGETETVVARADISENELSGESISYDLISVGDDGLAGTATFSERLNGETLVTLILEEAQEASEHPAFIHAGAVGEEQGDVTITLNPVEGGISRTNVSGFDREENDDEESVTYEDLSDYDGSINVYKDDEVEYIISQANIGSNATEE